MASTEGLRFFRLMAYLVSLASITTPLVALSAQLAIQAYAQPAIHPAIPKAATLAISVETAVLTLFTAASTSASPPDPIRARTGNTIALIAPVTTPINPRKLARDITPILLIVSFFITYNIKPEEQADPVITQKNL